MERVGADRQVVVDLVAQSKLFDELGRCRARQFGLGYLAALGDLCGFATSTFAQRGRASAAHGPPGQPCPNSISRAISAVGSPRSPTANFNRAGAPDSMRYFAFGCNQADCGSVAVARESRKVPRLSDAGGALRGINWDET